jgi:hypothetical protein
MRRMRERIIGEEMAQSGKKREENIFKNQRESRSRSE